MIVQDVAWKIHRRIFWLEREKMVASRFAQIPAIDGKAGLDESAAWAGNRSDLMRCPGWKQQEAVICWLYIGIGATFFRRQH